LNRGCLVFPVLAGEPLSEQRLATGGGNTRTPARRPGRHTGFERGLDDGGDELRGLRVDDDVPAEQHAADDPPGVRGRIVQADGGGAGTGGIGLPGYRRGLGHTPDCKRNGPGPVAGHAGFANLLRQPPGGARPVRAPPLIMSLIDGMRTLPVGVVFPQELGVRMPCPQLRKAAGGYRAVSMAVACQGKLPGQAAH
jgi:hypothetical protein